VRGMVANVSQLAMRAQHSSSTPTHGGRGRFERATEQQGRYCSECSYGVVSQQLPNLLPFADSLLQDAWDQRAHLHRSGSFSAVAKWRMRLEEWVVGGVA
jgi:hypothetical protein